MSAIAIQRVYDDNAESPEGKRILVDRLWPRGVTKERAHVDLWLKNIAPSTELRKAFHGGDIDWPEFRRRYLSEVRNNPGPFGELLAEAEKGPVVLLYGSRSHDQNHALILRELLRARLDETTDCADCIW